MILEGSGMSGVKSSDNRIRGFCYQNSRVCLVSVGLLTVIIHAQKILSELCTFWDKNWVCNLISYQLKSSFDMGYVMNVDETAFSTFCLFSSYVFRKQENTKILIGAHLLMSGLLTSDQRLTILIVQQYVRVKLSFIQKFQSDHNCWCQTY